MSSAQSLEAWVSRPRRNQSARMRLICVPFAGAGASVYQPWAGGLPAYVEVCAVQLPGRETRLQEPLRNRLPPLVQDLTTAIEPLLNIPYALYGHSFGALIAIHVARELRRRGSRMPIHLFVSGRPAPHLPTRDPMHRVTEAQLVERLRRMGGTPEAVLREPELMAIFLPILRADLHMNETSDFPDEAPLDCPISAFGGHGDDRAAEDEVDAWRQHTSKAFSAQMFPGGHFFIKSSQDALLRSISGSLDEIASSLAG